MNSNSKAVVTTTMGYMGIALSGWMIGMFNTGWFSTLNERALALSCGMAIIMGLMGILSYLQNRSLDAIVFLGMGGMRWVFYFYRSTGATAPPSYVGWYVFVWGIFFCYVWLGSFRSGTLRMLFLLAMTLSSFAEALGNWTGMHGFIIVCGYLGLTSSLLAAIISAMAVIRHGQSGDPNLTTENA
jgi:uncharacterized protein